MLAMLFAAGRAASQPPTPQQHIAVWLSESPRTIAVSVNPKLPEARATKISTLPYWNALTPESVLRLDLIADQMLELRRTDEAVNAIRAAVIHGVK
jgi:hypothetical protein